MKRHRYVHIALSVLSFSVLLQAQTVTSDAQLKVVSPNGGEVWTNGEVHLIQWTYDGVEQPRMFTVQLSTDRVKYFETIVAGLPTDVHEYKWRVNAADSKNCVIRVTAQVPLARRVLPAFRNVADVSDARFDIVTGAVKSPTIMQR